MAQRFWSNLYFLSDLSNLALSGWCGWLSRPLSYSLISSSSTLEQVWVLPRTMGQQLSLCLMSMASLYLSVFAYVAQNSLLSISHHPHLTRPIHDRAREPVFPVTKLSRPFFRKLCLLNLNEQKGSYRYDVEHSLFVPGTFFVLKSLMWLDATWSASVPLGVLWISSSLYLLAIDREVLIHQSLILFQLIPPELDIILQHTGPLQG